MKDVGSVPVRLSTKRTAETVFLVENAPPSFESTKPNPSWEYSSGEVQPTRTALGAQLRVGPLAK